MHDWLKDSALFCACALLKAGAVWGRTPFVATQTVALAVFRLTNKT